MLNIEILKRWNVQLNTINKVVGCDFSCIVNQHSERIQIVSEAKCGEKNQDYHQEILTILNTQVKGFELTDELQSVLKKHLEIGKLIAIKPIRKDCSNQWGYLILISSAYNELTHEELEMLEAMITNFSNDLELFYQVVTNQRPFDQRLINFLVESTSGVPWRMDFKTNEFKYVGSEGKRILGYEHEDWPTFEKWAACIHPDDREWATNYCYNCSIQDLNHVFEYRLIQKDGKIIWVRDIVIVKRDKQNEIAELVGFMINITHIKANEEDLKEANNRLEKEKNLLNNFIDTISAFVFIKDLDGKWLTVNRFYEEFYDLPRSSFIGKPLDGFIPDDVASYLKEKEQLVVSQKDVVNFEYSICDYRGDKKWFYASYFPVLNEKNEVENVCGTSVDITKIKELENESEKLNQQLEFVLNVTNTQLFIVDEQHEIIYNSKKGEAIREKCYKHLRGQEKKCSKCPRDHSSLDTLTTYYQTSHENNSVNYQVTTFPFKNNQGRVNIAVVRVDITDRIEIEKKIGQLNEQLEMSMLAGHIAFFEYDFNKNTFTSNKHVSDIVGFDISDNIDNNWLLSRVHPADQSKINERIKGFVGGASDNSELEFRFLNAEQQYLWLSVYINLGNKESQSITGIIQNITRHKELLIELEMERKKSKAANEAKTNFIASMSHEIRTPMNAILGFSDIMSKNLKDSVYKNYIHSIKTSGKLLLSLINDILDVSKIEAGKVSLKYEPTNIKQLLVDISETLRYSVNVKGLEMQVVHPENIPNRLFVDELRMKQIFLNLMNNAVKYTNEGSVTISYYFNKNREQGKGELFFTVTDTGVGIKADRQKAIFEPFEQEGKTINKHVQGTGLGLSIINKLVKLMNGSISLKSIEGSGSQFSIQIPGVMYDENDDEMTSVPENSLVKFNDESILIIDDIESNLDILELLLVNLGLKVEAIDNGREALKIIEKRTFDIVMCDINMPDMNGFEVLERMQMGGLNKNLKVIAVTASTLDQEVEEIMNAGFDDILTKPISEQSIIDVVSKYCINSAESVNEDCGEDLNEVFSKEDGLKLFNLLDDKATSIYLRLKQRTSTNDLNAFNQALEDCLNTVTIPLVLNYQKDIDIAIKSFDFESIQNLINNYESILNKLSK
ncbi:PAS domain-containing hybrid sensor histidine kinase/response regulator [Carboxylicivirga marina]|uniref:PAS domain-containing hybrid sensor histidine kinase/response regulator n=1 Tax=Carboxylicivirga marina TaxID=2800988 RepID=UPI00259AE9AD|nr:PAS domain-containing hybrid sensor histidine kinase/response regulator [uncultured Carboxylicivirga sp.]